MTMMMMYCDDNDDIDGSSVSWLMGLRCCSYDIVNSAVAVNKPRQLSVVKCVCSSCC